MNALPWLIEELKLKEQREDVRPDLDIELASALFLAENFRAGSGKITKKGKKARVTSVLKMGWPMWLATVGADECVFMDGLKTINQRALESLEHSASEIKDQIENLAPAEFLDSLQEIQSFTANPENITEIEGLMTNDLFNGVLKYARFQGEDYEFAVPLPSLLKEENVQALADFIVGYPARLDEIFGEAADIIDILNIKREQTLVAEDQTIAAITADYDTQHQELEVQVNETIARLGEEEQVEIDGINDVRAKEKENVISVIKQSIEPFVESIDLVKTTWDDSYTKVTSSTDEETLKGEVDHGINLLKQKVSDLSRAANLLEEELRGQIDRFGTIDEDFDQRVRDVHGKYAQRVSEEQDKLTHLDMEKREAIGSQELIKQKIDAGVAQCESALNQFNNRKDEKARIVANFKTGSPVGMEAGIAQFHLPFYFVLIEEEGEQFFTIAPPTLIGSQPQKKQDEISYNQKLLPLTIADPSFVTYYNEKFHQIMETTPEIADLVRESCKSDQLNALLSADKKEQAIKGLHYMKGRNLSKPKDMDKIILDVSQDFSA